MKLLLDTHLLLCAAFDPDKLSGALAELLEAHDSELFFSAASMWEIAIKSGLERVDFKVDPRQWRRVGRGTAQGQFRDIRTRPHHLAVSSIERKSHAQPTPTASIVTTSGLNDTWADAWITAMKREQNLSPPTSTIGNETHLAKCSLSVPQ